MIKGASFKTNEKLVKCKVKSALEKNYFVLYVYKTIGATNSFFNEQIFFSSLVVSSGKKKVFFAVLKRIVFASPHVRSGRRHLYVSVM